MRLLILISLPSLVVGQQCIGMYNVGLYWQDQPCSPLHDPRYCHDRVAYKDGFDPDVVFDDRDQVVEMWRANGIPVVQTAEGDF